MSVIGIIVYQYDPDKSIRIADCLNESLFTSLKMRLYAKNIKEAIYFASRLVINRTDCGTKQSIKMNDLDYVVHSYVTQTSTNQIKLGIAMISDIKYPPINAFTIISMIVKSQDLFTIQHLTADAVGTITQHAYLEKILNYALSTNNDKNINNNNNNNNTKDKINGIKEQIDEVTNIMSKNLDDLMKRGEKLDDLIASTEELSKLSKDFGKKAKKLNRCCVLL